ncbi:DsbA family protein [Vibrio sp. T187]|uniref:DsbA family protein n=1 Tax=Vibrio TaxID=662 RepID=UPI0010C9CC73|nr:MULTISPECIES: DsbA family protein [Vibrio]MBW3695559.1 DsbA family protein [Vibrio sp. T187]
MNKLILWAAISAALSSSLVHATDLDAQQKQKIEQVSKLLEENPEVIDPLYTSLSNYITKADEFDKAQKQSHDWLYNNPDLPFIGNPNGKTVLLNFTDYDCPYCKKLDPVLSKLVKNYPDLKIVSVLTPLKQKGDLPDIETNATLYALTVWKEAPEHFEQVNQYLFAKNSGHSKQSLNAIAKKTDTVAQLHASQQVRTVVDNNYMAFHELGLRGTPAMMLGDKIIPGYLPYDRLKNILSKEIEAAS